MFWMQWTSANQPVFQVLLVLISFVLSWGEAWFFDFQVLPHELQAMEYMQGKKNLNAWYLIKEGVLFFVLSDD